MILNIFQNIKSFIYGCITGVLITVIACCALYFTSDKHHSGSKGIITTQISGDKIEHRDWNFSGDSISFKTDAVGEGEAMTTVPKELIPEANAYLHKTNIIQTDFLFLNHSGRLDSIIGISYFHRWNDFAIGGGPLFSKNVFTDKIYGVKLSAQYGF